MDYRDQFGHLLAYLIASVNQTLAAQPSLFPLNLLLTDAGKVEISVSAFEEEDETPLSEQLNSLQAGAKAKVAAGGYVASCTAWPNYADKCLVALFENANNDVLGLSIPVVRRDENLALDDENAEPTEADVYIFPFVDDE
ncbi:MAG: hypothetical protein AAFX44_17865 [Pseudomonadota bacterium]